MVMKNSPVLCYFDELHDGDTKLGSCKSCKTSLKCSSGSTSPLINHLKMKHKNLYLELRQKKGGEKVSVVESKQNTELTAANDFVVLSEKESSPVKLESPRHTEKMVLEGGNFSNDLVNIFQELKDDIEFTNVTLVTDGGAIIKAHKVVLSSFSPFFKDLLIKNPHQHPLLYMRGVNYADLRAIIDFIYLGQTKVEMSNFSEFITLATDLQIKGLRTSTEVNTVTEQGPSMKI